LIIFGIGMAAALIATLLQSPIQTARYLPALIVWGITFGIGGGLIMTVGIPGEIVANWIIRAHDLPLAGSECTLCRPAQRDLGG
jgi:hypothetical protein